MKRTRILTAMLAALCLLFAAAGCGAETYLETNGEIPDRTVYQGHWQNVYLRVLDKYYGGRRDKNTLKILGLW